MNYIAGWDLGLKGDYSAFVLLGVAPAIKTQTEETPETYIVRAIHRWPLDTKYTQQVSDVAEWLYSDGERQRATLVVDRTGVGNGVIELISAAGLGFDGISIIGVGETHQVVGGWNVLKRDLVAAVEVVLEQKRFKIAPGQALGPALMNELEGFRRQRTPSGHVKYEAGADWRSAPHDDLVLATAMAVWYASQQACCGRLILFGFDG